MAANMEEEPDLPDEVVHSLQDFHQSLLKAENVLKPFLDIPVNDLYEKLDVLERAKADLVVAYSINSLFWMYLLTQGIDPKEHPVKQELERIRTYMGKLKEASGKKRKAGMRIDKEASKRFMRSALWQPEENKKPSASEQPSQEKRKHSDCSSDSQQNNTKKKKS